MKAISSTLLGVVFSFFVAGNSAHANLLLTGNPTFGANSVVIDTSTGLGWLKPVDSTGLSYHQVLADMQPGGMFNGFEYATDQQVLGLFASAGIPGPGAYQVSNASILSFLSLFGGTSSQSGNPEIFGISGTSENGLQMVPGIDFAPSNGVPIYHVTGLAGQTIDYGLDFGASTVGNWLVFTVPEPGIYALAATGLAGFILLHRRKKASNQG